MTETISQRGDNSLVDHASDIVAAYVSHNSVPTSELPQLIASIHSALAQIATGKPPAAPEPELVPAVSVRSSIKNDFIVCLEDGKRFKSLKRHLGTKYGMTPEQYRAKWNLPSDYPMVAPVYAQKRSELAKSIGLGRKPEPAKVAARGRKKAAA